jgi:hypothetical protein
MKLFATLLVCAPLVCAAAEDALRESVASMRLVNRERAEAARVMGESGFRCNLNRTYVPPTMGAPAGQVSLMNCTRTVAEPRCTAQRVSLKMSLDERVVESIASLEERACF